MKRALGSFTLILITLAALPAAAGAVAASSPFTASSEGWEVTGTTSCEEVLPPDILPAEHKTTGGNPGGYISAVDNETPAPPAGQRDKCSWIARAPLAFSGDMRANYGGTLRYDVRHPAGADFGGAVAIFDNAGDSIQGAFETPPAANEWERYPFDLVETAPEVEWLYVNADQSDFRTATRADFFAILRNVAGIAVVGDLSENSRGDRTDIDNVVLTEAPSPLDSDGDGVTNAADDCPLQPGPAASNGCPQPAPPGGGGAPDGGSATQPSSAPPTTAVSRSCKRARASLAAATRRLKRLRREGATKLALKAQEKKKRRAGAAVKASCGPGR